MHNYDAEGYPIPRDHYTYSQMRTDNFIGEVIGIVAPKSIHIDIAEGNVDRDNPVCIRFTGRDADGWEFSCVRHGRTIGSTLRAIREQLRTESGR